MIVPAGIVALILRHLPSGSLCKIDRFQTEAAYITGFQPPALDLAMLRI